MKTRRPHIPYSAEELAWIEAHRALPQREAAALFTKTFDRSDVTYENYRALCKRKGWHTGRDGRFSKGHEPWSKGRHLPEHPNSVATRFKKGDRPFNKLAIGQETIDCNGYVKICVDRPNPWTGAPTFMAFKHRELWEQANGPIPEGHALKCLDGDKTNCDPSNWACIPRAMLPRLNGRFGRDYDNAPDALKPTIMATTKLEHAAREAGK